MITIDQLAACTGARGVIAAQWRDAINAAMGKYQITSPQRVAAFLAQIGHESGGLSRVRENLNYTPEALMATFNLPGKIRFTKTDAYRYGRTADHPADQTMIASIAYASRMGNGPMETLDGWRFRGGGPGQLTGRSNYRACGAAIGFDLEREPTLIERRDVGALAFGWFWDVGNPSGRSLNGPADVSAIDEVSRLVNGGRNGRDERRALYFNALKVLT